MKMIILPLQGLECDGMRIAFGESQAEIGEKLGRPQIWGTSLYYFQNILRMDFNENAGLEYIEFLSPDSRLRAELYGIDPFSAPADSVAALLREKNGGEMTDIEDGYGLTFNNISVGVYRDTTPQEAEETVREAAAEGVPLSQEEYDAELAKANRWDTVGFGVAGYFG